MAVRFVPLALSFCAAALLVSFSATAADRVAASSQGKSHRAAPATSSAEQRKKALEQLMKQNVTFGDLCGPPGSFAILPSRLAAWTLESTRDVAALHRVVAYGSVTAKVYALEALRKLGKLRPWDKKIRRELVRRDAGIRICGGCIVSSVPVSRVNGLAEFRKAARSR